ncbi:hypothetical protein EYC84_011864 [Monilinia fructicola]|uniref:Uncharacterized protein n=1 Tax=Monilinia fructicola TaxID=38448 RepID=A0A5M9J7J4_MONFR|nr:hypothetical protein EYC84_011864 [Monilinia fructicola]
MWRERQDTPAGVKQPEISGARRCVSGRERSFSPDTRRHSAKLKAEAEAGLRGGTPAPWSSLGGNGRAPFGKGVSLFPMGEADIDAK